MRGCHRFAPGAHKPRRTGLAAAVLCLLLLTSEAEEWQQEALEKLLVPEIPGQHVISGIMTACIQPLEAEHVGTLGPVEVSCICIAALPMEPLSCLHMTWVASDVVLWLQGIPGRGSARLSCL